MRRLLLSAAAMFGLIMAPNLVSAQNAAGTAPDCEPQRPLGADFRQPSPYDSMVIELGDALAKICYSRPSLRGRTMIGGEAVPFGTIWRTGANEPTTIHVPVAAEIAGIPVESGKYSIYTVPREDGDWTLIVNASASQWGDRSSYTPEVEAQEVGRATVPTERIQELVETMTFRTAPAEGAATDLILEWQHTRVRILISRGGG